MSTEAKIQLRSTELGRIWMSYQIESMMIATFGNLRDSTIDEEAKGILNLSLIEEEKIIAELRKIFNNQNAVIPIAFDDRDVLKMRLLFLMIFST